MSIAPHLLEILRCPESLGALLYLQGDGGEYLFCPQSKLRYRVEDGIPVMLIDDAERLDDDACAAILAAQASDSKS